MQAAEIGLRLVGVFYCLAGMVAMRGVVMDRMMDLMLSAISLKPQPVKEAQRRWLWGVSALAITMGGAALLVLNLWSIPLFLVGLGTQVFYLAWARTAFAPENDDEEKGRRQTRNAAILYGLATILVLAAAYGALLRHWFDIWALAVPLSGVALMASVGRNLLWSARRPGAFPAFDTEDDGDFEPEPLPPLHRVRLEPRWGSYPLMDADSGEERLPDLYLPAELADRIHTWSYSFGADDDTRSLYAMFEDDAHEAAHRREAEEIVAELKTIFGDDNATGPFYPEKTVYVGPETSGD